MSNYIFVIDGPDGVGKTTLISKLTKYFNESTSYKAFSLTPSNTDFGKGVKTLLNEFKPNNEVQKLLQLATINHLKDDIDSILESSTKEISNIIFLDRWLTSTGVYQEYCQHGNQPFYQGKEFVERLPVITLNVILDAPDEILDARLNSRDNKDLYEVDEFQRKVREGYRRIFDYRPGKYKQVVVDGGLEENFKKLLSVIIDKLY